MRIELEQLLAPNQGEVRCGVCERAFEMGVVVARLTTNDGGDGGEVCETCVEHLSRLPLPEDQAWRFPGPDEIRRLEGVWQTPKYATVEEIPWGS